MQNSRRIINVNILQACQSPYWNTMLYRLMTDKTKPYNIHFNVPICYKRCCSFSKPNTTNVMEINVKKKCIHNSGMNKTICQICMLFHAEWNIVYLYVLCSLMQCNLRLHWQPKNKAEHNVALSCLRVHLTYYCTAQKSLEGQNMGF